MPASPQPKWLAIKPKLTSLTQPELIDLVKSLFDHSADNKLFLTARLSPAAISAELLEPYRKRIVDQFFPARGFGKLNLRDARQAIRDYRKATSDLAGTLELMMTYVEQGTRFTNEYGDINEAYYNSLESVLGEITAILKSPEGQSLYDTFYDRLDSLRRNADRIGWGYGDDVRELVNDLEAFVEEQEAKV